MHDKQYISANDYLLDNWRLAAAVRRRGWRPDFILGLWRGGAPVAVAVHEFFKVTGWDVQHIPLKCVSYTGIGENKGGVAFTHGDIVFGMFRKGDRVLVVDDVFDTGKTAAAVKRRMDAAGIDMRMACVYWKPEKNTPGPYARDRKKQKNSSPQEERPTPLCWTAFCRRACRSRRVCCRPYRRRAYRSYRPYRPFPEPQVQPVVQVL